MTRPFSPKLVTIVVLLAAVALVPPSAQVLNTRRGDLALTLDCVVSTHITFSIRNVGESDTIVRLGSYGGRYRSMICN